jgi:protein-tyrosine phosphatase
LLFVCHGNIMRSPLAAAVCRLEASRRGLKVIVDSAGLHAVAGRAADPRAARVADSLGVSLNGHTAQPVTPALVAAADLILVMDHANDAELVARFPGAWPKVRLLGVFSGDADGGVIADPYDADPGVLAASAERIASAVRRLLGLLEPAQSGASGGSPG